MNDHLRRRRRPQPTAPLTRLQRLEMLLAYLRHTSMSVEQVCAHHPDVWNAYTEVNAKLRSPDVNDAEAALAQDIFDAVEDKAAKPAKGEWGFETR